jgi:hypothetical protein
MELMRKSLSSISKHNSLKQTYQTFEKHGIEKQNTVTTTFAGLKIISANDRDFTHVIEENEEPESGEESAFKKEDDDNCDPFYEIDNFVGVSSKKEQRPKKEERPKLFDMGDDIHNLCDSPASIPKEAM